MRIPYLLLVWEVVDNLHDQQHMRASHDFFGTTQLIRPVMPKILRSTAAQLVKHQHNKALKSLIDCLNLLIELGTDMNALESSQAGLTPATSLDLPALALCVLKRGYSQQVSRKLLRDKAKLDVAIALPSLNP
ncbi:TPA: hypothetical protein ACH3X3_011153 [Trebouxia sp. C0006]